MYQVISNFNGGLDARKYFLSLPPGTLTTLLNGHITQGGEIEKRKAFVPVQLPMGTFGAQETLDGIVVFGSRVLPAGNFQTLFRQIELNTIAIIELNNSYGIVNFLSGDTVHVSGMGDARYDTTATVLVGDRGYPPLVIYPVPFTTSEAEVSDTGGTVSLVIPPGIIYQQLTHPIAGVNMTGVLSSTYFNGKVEVITTWDNGDTLVFYDGAVVPDFYLGAYGSIEPSAYSMAKDIVTEINAGGSYTATLQPLEKLTVQVTGGAPLAGLVITAGAAGSAGNSIATTTTSTAISWGAATLTGGAAGTAATGTLSGQSTNVASGDKVTIGATAYTFVTALTGTKNEVLIGADVQASLTNLAADINGSAGAGMTYNVGPVASTQVSAGAVTGSQVTITALATGVAGNSITTFTTSAKLSWGAATLAGGASGVAAAGTLTVSGSLANGDTVSIGGMVYTFVTALTGTENEVLISASDPTGTGSLARLVADINGASGAGTTYSPGPVASTQVAAGTSAGLFSGNELTGLVYNFQRPITLTNLSTGNPQSGTAFPLVNTPVLFAANGTTATTAADVCTVVQANYFGFQASVNGNVVTIWPPATDANRVALAVNGSDVLNPTVAGNFTVYVPVNDAVFDVFSIPTQSSPTPYSVAVTTQSASLGYDLVSNGVAATAPANAAGQFAITAGGGNPTASGVLGITGVPANNVVVTIGATQYTFVTALTNTPNQVLRDLSSASNCLQNLVAAINGTAGAGTAYSSGTVTSTQVSASAVVGGATTITATTGGSAGNLIALSYPVGAPFTGAGNLAGGGAAAMVLIKAVANPANADTITIAGVTYRFRSSFTSAAAFDVVIGGSIDATLTNLLLAINGTGLAGTTLASDNYYSGTTAHPTVTCINQDTTNHILYLAAKATGSGGNTLAVAKSSSALTLLEPDAATTATTFTGGGANTNQVTQVQVGTTSLLRNPVPYDQSANQTAADVVTAINNYSGTSGFTATAQNNVVTVTAAAAGASVNEAVISVQCQGNVCVAACSFSVTAATSSGISVIQATDGNGVHQLLTNAGLTFQQTGYTAETLPQYLARVVANINANTANANASASGYLAYSSGAQVWLSKATVTSADVGPDPKAGIEITSTLAVTTAATTALTLTNNTQSIGFTTLQLGAIGRTNYYSNNEPASAVVTVSGGVAPYTYQWSSASTSPDAIPQLTNTSNQWWNLVTVKSTGLKPPATTQVPAHSEIWICTVTDSAGTTVVSAPFYLQIPTIAVNA